MTLLLENCVTLLKLSLHQISSWATLEQNACQASIFSRLLTSFLTIFLFLWQLFLVFHRGIFVASHTYTHFLGDFATST